MVAIKDKNLRKQLTFKSIPRSEIEKEVLSLDNSKVSQDSSIPTKIVKLNADVFFKYIF